MSVNPNYLYSYSLKMLIWIFVFVFVFNMDVRWMYSDPIFNIIRIRHYPKYPTYPTLFVSEKIKYPYKPSKIYLYY
jgi:hypothetical protein